MLNVEHIQSGYGGVTVVHDVSFQVAEKQLVGLIGSNGAGKSTILSTVTGLIKPQSGVINYNGRDIAGLPAHKIAQMGISMVPEGRHLFGRMSVQDNLMMGAYNVRDKNAQKCKLEEVYAIFPRVKERLGQMAETLSGGEQQMVAIARGLMSDPKLLILDEPSLGLAPNLVSEVFEFVRKIKTLGVTIILVEQNVHETMALADYVYVVQNGETVLSGTREEMQSNEQIKKAYLGL